MPKPSKESWKDRYTWDTAPRWDRQVVEAGCYARIWTTAERWAWAWRPAYYAALIAWMLVFPAAAQRFIYFQF